MLQTTSLNCSILAALDLAKRQALPRGGENFSRVIKALKWKRAYINSTKKDVLLVRKCRNSDFILVLQNLR
jgi:arginine/lysine/ornithine decarboxylase